MEKKKTSFHCSEPTVNNIGVISGENFISVIQSFYFFFILFDDYGLRHMKIKTPLFRKIRQFHKKKKKKDLMSNFKKNPQTKVC